ncbi:MAG: DUF2934 domain-containing protein [Chromatiales bacterium]
MAATKLQSDVEYTARGQDRAAHAEAEARWVATRARRDAEPGAAAPAGAEREQRVRELAYAIAQQHGFTPGRELQDWLEAERQVDAERWSARRLPFDI